MTGVQTCALPIFGFPARQLCKFHNKLVCGSVGDRAEAAVFWKVHQENICNAANCTTCRCDQVVVAVAVGVVGEEVLGIGWEREGILVGCVHDRNPHS